MATFLGGRSGQLIVAEPLEIDINDVPDEINAWNQDSIASILSYSVPAEDPDEAPISREFLLECIDEVGLKIEVECRAWELFPKNQPPSKEDRAVWHSNVFALLQLSKQITGLNSCLCGKGRGFHFAMA